MKKLLATLALSICLTQAYATETAPPLERPDQWAQPVSPEKNLYKISDTLYRSEQLQSNDLEQLQALNIKTVVNLRSSNKDQKVLVSPELTLVHVPMRAWAVKEEQVAEALWQIRKAERKGSVLFHCYHGSDRTGLVLAMYRIVYQNWTIADAHKEMKEGGYGFNRIWVNIDEFFTPEKVETIKTLLAQKEKSS